MACTLSDKWQDHVVTDVQTRVRQAVTKPSATREAAVAGKVETWRPNGSAVRGGPPGRLSAADADSDKPITGSTSASVSDCGTWARSGLRLAALRSALRGLLLELRGCRTFCRDAVWSMACPCALRRSRIIAYCSPSLGPYIGRDWCCGASGLRSAAATRFKERWPWHTQRRLWRPARPTLVMALDLGREQWRLAFAICARQRTCSPNIRDDHWW